MPYAILVKFHDLSETFLPEDLGHGPGVYAVKPTAMTWEPKLSTVKSSAQSGSKHKVSARRTQVPLMPAKHSTLHGLQGTTARPGLVAHWRMPGLDHSQKWLATYVMMSRPPSFSAMLSFGLPDRTVIEGGPPSALTNSQAQLWHHKIELTKAKVAEARRTLGWQSIAGPHC